MDWFDRQQSLPVLQPLNGLQRRDPVESTCSASLLMLKLQMLLIEDMLVCSPLQPRPAIICIHAGTNDVEVSCSFEVRIFWELKIVAFCIHWPQWASNNPVLRTFHLTIPCPLAELAMEVIPYFSRVMCSDTLVAAHTLVAAPPV